MRSLRCFGTFEKKHTDSDTEPTFKNRLLLSHPECYKRLQQEIDVVYPSGSDPLDVSKHSQLRYLAACMFVTALSSGLNVELKLPPPTVKKLCVFYRLHPLVVQEKSRTAAGAQRLLDSS